MPTHNWFYPIPLSGKNRRKRDRLNALYSRGGDESNLRQPPKPATYHAIRQHRYRKTKIGLHETYTYRIDDLAAIIGVHRNTIQRWYNLNMLPQPFINDSISYRSWGWTHRPLYLREQVLVIVRVLNNLYAQGITQYRQSHIHHTTMMREGNRIAIERLNYKMVKPKLVKPITPPASKRTLRHRPAPHMRPFLHYLRAALKHQHSQAGAA
jgi:hypothetical protein